jgi:hypothetical protein
MYCIHFYVKVPKTATNVFWLSDLLRKGHAFPGQALYTSKIQTFISKYGVMGVIKRI